MKKEIWIFYILYWENKEQKSKRIEYGFKEPVSIDVAFINCIHLNKKLNLIEVKCLNSPAIKEGYKN